MATSRIPLFPQVSQGNKRRFAGNGNYGPSDVWVHPALVSIQVAFSGWHVLAKVALNEGVNPLALALEREVLAASLMWYCARRWDGPQRLEPRHRRRLLLMGFFCFVNALGVILALKFISTTGVALMQPSVPVFTMVMSIFMGMERWSKLKAVGVLVATLGAVYVELNSAVAGEAAGSSHVQTVIGVVLLGVQCLAMSALTVTQRHLVLAYPSLTVTAWYHIVGAAYMVVASIIGRVSVTDLLLTRRLEPWIALLYAVVFASFFTYNASAWALGLVHPTIVTVYWTLQPAMTAILSLVFLGAPISVQQVVGGIIICGGLVTTTIAKARERRKVNKEIRDTISDDLHDVFADKGKPPRSSISLLDEDLEIE